MAHRAWIHRAGKCPNRNSKPDSYLVPKAGHFVPHLITSAEIGFSYFEVPSTLTPGRREKLKGLGEKGRGSRKGAEVL